MVIGSLVYVVNEGVIDTAKAKGKAAWEALNRKGHEDDTFGDDLVRRGVTKLGNKMHLGGKGKTALGWLAHNQWTGSKIKAGAVAGGAIGTKVGTALGGPIGGMAGGAAGALGGAAITGLKPTIKWANKIYKGFKTGSGKGIYYNADDKKKEAKK